MFITRLDSELWVGDFINEGFQVWNCIEIDHEPSIYLSVVPTVESPRPKAKVMSVAAFAALCCVEPSSLAAFSSIDLSTSPEINRLGGWKTYKLLELTEWITQDGLFHWFECRTEEGDYYAGQPGELMISSPRPTLPPKMLYKAVRN